MITRRSFLLGAGLAGLSGGAGLWLANQLCDLVQISSSARGTTVRVYQAAGR